MAPKPPTPAASKSAPPLNPNWAQLREKLRSHTNPHTLGKRKLRDEPPPAQSTAPVPSPPLPVRLCPSSDDCSVTRAVSMDCEMVGVSSVGNRSALGRVSLVNSWGNVLYDEYVRPVERIVDFRSSISGIRPKHLKTAKEFWLVQKEVSALIKGRILVGHALRNDLKVLLLSHPKKDIRDTSEYELFRREGRKKSLKALTAKFLGVKIQENEHCSVEDARAAMFIYNKHKKEWEKSVKDAFRLKRKLNNKKRKSKGDAEGSTMAAQ